MTVRLSKGKLNVILLSGKAGSGKDTVANLLEVYLPQIGYNVAVKRTSRSLKSVSYILGWDGIKDERGRKLLQHMADVIREYDEDSLIRIVEDDMMNTVILSSINTIIITDWRMPNELEYLKNNLLLNVIPVRVVGKTSLSGESSTHITEVSLGDDDEIYACRIPNLGTIEELNDEVLDFVGWLSSEG